MGLTVHPDPQSPAGGYAFLELPGGSLSDDQITVAVYDAYGERWLAAVGAGEGRAGWQTERHGFGPYDVIPHDDADWVHIGPEIVDRLEEYAPLRIEVDGQGYDVVWPDDVPPRARAATRGGLQATAVVAPVPAPSPPPSPPLAPPAAPKTELPEAGPKEDPVSAKPAAPAQARHGVLWVAILIFLLLAALAAAWWFWPRSGQQETSTDCSAPALAAVTGGFSETGKAIRACAGKVTPETVLELVEDAARRGDPDALLLFGTLYDGAQLDQKIESDIGLSFAHDAATAAEYYARAVEAGSNEAGERLTATCAQLSGSDSTLAKGAYDDFCR